MWTKILNWNEGMHSATLAEYMITSTSDFTSPPKCADGTVCYLNGRTDKWILSNNVWYAFYDNKTYTSNYIVPQPVYPGWTKGKWIDASGATTSYNSVYVTKDIFPNDYVSIVADATFNNIGVVFYDNSNTFIKMECYKNVNSATFYFPENARTYRIQLTDLEEEMPIADVETVKIYEHSEVFRMNYYNQRAQYTLASTIERGITLTNNNDGSYTANGTASQDVNFNINVNSSDTGYVKNHKYYMFGSPSGSSFYTYYLYTYISGVEFYASDTGTGKIFTVTSSSNYIQINIKIASGTTVSNLTFYPRLIDLTAVFGAGNEPTSLDDNNIFKLKKFSFYYPDYVVDPWYINNKQWTWRKAISEQGAAYYNDNIAYCETVYDVTEYYKVNITKAENTGDVYGVFYNNSNTFVSMFKLETSETNYVPKSATKMYLMYSDNVKVTPEIISGLNINITTSYYHPYFNNAYTPYKSASVPSISNGCTWTRNEDDSLHVQGTLTGTYTSYYIRLGNNTNDDLSICAGHKYIVPNFTSVQNTTGSTYITDSTNNIRYWTIGTLTNNIPAIYVSKSGAIGDVINDNLEEPWIVDITAIYGIGKEPATIDSTIIDIANYARSHTDYKQDVWYINNCKWTYRKYYTGDGIISNSAVQAYNETKYSCSAGDTIVVKWTGNVANAYGLLYEWANDGTFVKRTVLQANVRNIYQAQATTAYYTFGIYNNDEIDNTPEYITAANPKTYTMPIGYNQLVNMRADAAGTTTRNGVTATYNETDGSYIITGTNTYDNPFSIAAKNNQWATIIKDHKYYIYGPVQNMGQLKMELPFYKNSSLVLDKYINNDVDRIFSTNVNADAVSVYMRFASDYVASEGDIYRCSIVDLTDIYGYSQEPTSTSDPRIIALNNCLMYNDYVYDPTKWIISGKYYTKSKSLNNNGSPIYDNLSAFCEYEYDVSTNNIVTITSTGTFYKYINWFNNNTFISKEQYDDNLGYAIAPTGATKALIYYYKAGGWTPAELTAANITVTTSAITSYWNNALDLTRAESLPKTTNGCTWSRNADNSIHCEGTLTAEYTSWYTRHGNTATNEDLSIVPGHCYLMPRKTSLQSMTYTEKQKTDELTYVKVDTIISGQNPRLYYAFTGEVGDVINENVEEPWIIDITAIYGYGNEPATIDANLIKLAKYARKHPEYKQDVWYIDGKKWTWNKAMTSDGAVRAINYATCENKYTVSEGDIVTLSAENASRWISYYDSSDNFIERIWTDSTGRTIAPANSAYFYFGCHNSNGCTPAMIDAANFSIDIQAHYYNNLYDPAKGNQIPFTNNGVSFTYTADGNIHAEGTLTANYAFFWQIPSGQNTDYRLTVGHQYLYPYKYAFNGVTQEYITSDENWGRITKITGLGSGESQTTMRYYWAVGSGSGTGTVINTDTEYPWLIDLTAIYGTGLEPSSFNASVQSLITYARTHKTFVQDKWYINEKKWTWRKYYSNTGNVGQSNEMASIENKFIAPDNKTITLDFVGNAQYYLTIAEFDSSNAFIRRDAVYNTSTQHDVSLASNCAYYYITLRGDRTATLLIPTPEIITALNLRIADKVPNYNNKYNLDTGADNTLPYTQNGVTFSRNTDGSIHAEGTVGSAQAYAQWYFCGISKNNYFLVPGHYYYQNWYSTNINDIKVNQYPMTVVNKSSVNEKGRIFKYDSWTGSGSNHWYDYAGLSYIVSNTGTTVNADVPAPVVVDLTDIFGYGQEPISLSDSRMINLINYIDIVGTGYEATKWLIDGNRWTYCKHLNSVGYETNALCDYLEQEFAVNPGDVITFSNSSVCYKYILWYNGETVMYRDTIDGTTFAVVVPANATKAVISINNNFTTGGNIPSNLDAINFSVSIHNISYYNNATSSTAASTEFTTNNGDGTYTVNGDEYFRMDENMYKVYLGHKYYQRCYNGETGTLYVRMDLKSGNPYSNAARSIWTPDNEASTLQNYVCVRSYNAGYPKTYSAWLIDLTDIYGYGNEPTTLTDSKLLAVDKYIETVAGTTSVTVSPWLINGKQWTWQKVIFGDGVITTNELYAFCENKYTASGGDIITLSTTGYVSTLAVFYNSSNQFISRVSLNSGAISAPADTSYFYIECQKGTGFTPDILAGYNPEITITTPPDAMLSSKDTRSPYHGYFVLDSKAAGWAAGDTISDGTDTFTIETIRNTGYLYEVAVTYNYGFKYSTVGSVWTKQ